MAQESGALTAGLVRDMRVSHETAFLVRLHDTNTWRRLWPQWYDQTPFRSLED